MKIVLIISAAVSLAVIVFRLVDYFQEKSLVNHSLHHYILDKKSPTNTSSKKTVMLFRSLEQKFAVQSVRSMDEHLSKVQKYLRDQFHETEAMWLFELYQKHLACEMQLANHPQYQFSDFDSGHHLILLNKAHNLRRRKIGRETADVLYGREVKEREYLLRQAMIIGDQSLFGKEKEKRLQKLKVDMWSDAEEMPPDDPNPYNRYQIRLQLYQKDLTGLDEGARRMKIEEFRKDFFSGEQMKKLAAVDDRIAEEQEMLKRYRLAEREILLKKYITQAEKNKRITDLQDEFFGRDVEAFRRREAMSANVGK